MAAGWSMECGPQCAVPSAAPATTGNAKTPPKGDTASEMATRHSKTRIRLVILSVRIVVFSPLFQLKYSESARGYGWIDPDGP
jgi:hypothetical protein